MTGAVNREQQKMNQTGTQIHLCQRYRNGQITLPGTANKTGLRYDLLIKNEALNLAWACPLQENFCAAISLSAPLKRPLLLINRLK